MKQSQSLRLGQQLAMTPALQQSIRLLQMSTLDLNLEVQAQLEGNFMLERLDDGADSSSADAAADAEPQEQTPAETEADEPERDTDWDTPAGEPAGDDEWQHASLHQTPSLHEHLLWQARMHPFDALGFALAEHIIDAINDNGYVEDWQTLCGRLLSQPGVSQALLDQVLAQVQCFDPTGVAARDTGECLQLQLLQLEAQTPGRSAALALLDAAGLALLATRNPERIATALNGDSEAASLALHLVQTLAPHPGAAFSHPEASYLTPEVFVRRQRGQWQVQLNPKIAPRLRINPEYAALVRRSDSSSEQQTLKQHLQDARFFLHSLKSRNDTLLRVAQCIVAKQHGFLDYGAEAMRPMILRDISQQLGMHESTVSRATAGKYMATPRGVFELKYFFSSRLATTTGGEASATAIQAIIRRLVQDESARRPHSDSKLTELLLAEGVKVARRTVAKYREAMHIPPSHERKGSSA